MGKAATTATGFQITPSTIAATEVGISGSELVHKSTTAIAIDVTTTRKNQASIEGISTEEGCTTTITAINTSFATTNALDSSCCCCKH